MPTSQSCIRQARPRHFPELHDEPIFTGHDPYGALFFFLFTFYDKNPRRRRLSHLRHRRTQIAAGDRRAWALRNGTLHCWGLNDRYQIGDTATTMRLTPIAAHNMPAAMQSFALGTSASCAVFSERIGRCWGTNVHGQAGSGGVTTGGIPVPEPLSHWLRDDLIFRYDFELR